MSFHRVRRQLLDKEKPFPVAPDGLVLQWKDSPPSPVMTIYIGDDLLAQAFTGHFVKRARFFVGKFDDAGKLALQFTDVTGGDFRVTKQQTGHMVHLPSYLSVEFFKWCGRTAIPAKDIEVRAGLVIFSSPWIKA